MTKPNIEQRAVADLIPYASNSRTHSDAQVAQIAASIKEFGWTNPILIDGEGSVIAGHGRLLAARKLGMEEVPAIVLDHLTKAQQKALVIADNQLALNAGWDMDLLKAEIEGLKLEDFDIDLLGFDDKFLDGLLEPEPTEGLTDEDAVPEVPETPKTVLGDVWVLGNHRLMCGDSTSIDAVEKLMDGRKADMVFTDPPYGVDYQGGHFHSGDVNIKRKRERLANDDSAAIYTDVIPIIAAFCEGPCYTWFADTKPVELYNAVSSVGEIHALIIWHKTNATYAAMNAQYKQRHEPCLYWKPKGKTLKWCGATTETTIWDLKRDARNDFHPTQKPVALAEKAILNHSVGLVADFFAGSGSTLIACEKTNRNCLAIEFNPVYCDVIIKRWQDFTGKQAVHAETGEPFDASR
jgi:DNA modification methylase